MARENTTEEAATRREMIDAYRSQETWREGFDDWGKYTAHVVCAQRQEIKRLQRSLESKWIDAGSWDDPFGR